MVGLTKERIEKEGWSNTTVAQINAEDTKLQDSHYTHVLTNFGVMAFANPSAALKECHRILQPNGICAFTTWGSIPWLTEMKAAMSAVPGLPTLPSDEEMDVPNIFSKEKIWHDASAVRAYTEKHDFANVESKWMEAKSVLSDPVELRAILKPPVTLITRFFWTQDEREKFDNDETYDRIFDWFERRLEQGPMEWVWTAIVTTATKPA